jgi:hypothetical protein
MAEVNTHHSAPPSEDDSIFTKEEIKMLHDAKLSLQSYVRDYIRSLDILQAPINEAYKSCL